MIHRHRAAEKCHACQSGIISEQQCTFNPPGKKDKTCGTARTSRQRKRALTTSLFPSGLGYLERDYTRVRTRTNSGCGYAAYRYAVPVRCFRHKRSKFARRAAKTRTPDIIYNYNDQRFCSVRLYLSSKCPIKAMLILQLPRVLHRSHGSVKNASINRDLLPKLLIVLAAANHGVLQRTKVSAAHLQRGVHRIGRHRRIIR